MASNLEESQYEFVCKEQFNKAIRSLNERQDKEKPLWTRERVEEAISAIEQFKIAPILKVKRTNKQYYYGKKYDVIEIGTTKSLIFKQKSASDPVVIIVPMEEFHQILRETHVATGHGGRDKILFSLKSRFFIPTSAVLEFLKLCTVCQSKRKTQRRGNAVRQIASINFNNRGQVDIIDLQSTAYGDYKWLLHYQDHATKFTFLRPLTSESAAEVAMELLKIFLEIGCPYILQSDKGREFTGAIIQELASLWPTCKIINGKPNPETQGSVERSNADVEAMLGAWLSDNNTNNWTIGCYFVQFQKNSSINRNTQLSPFKSLFGTEPSTGLQSTHISKELHEKLTTEEDLEQLCKEKNSPNTSTSENLSSTQLIGNDHSLTSNLEYLPTIEPITQLGKDHDPTKSVPTFKTEVFEPKAEVADTEVNRHCLICGHESTVAHSCDILYTKTNSEHLISGNNVKEEGHGSKYLEISVNTMEDSLKTIKEELVDSTVWVDVPKVDSSPIDINNVSGIELDKNNDLYQTGASAEMIKDWLSRNELRKATTTFTETVPSTGKISVFGGQKVKKCHCEESKVQCKTNRCFCKRSNVPCNIRCHKSTTCFNKCN